jgi:hypothetical protein
MILDKSEVINRLIFEKLIDSNGKITSEEKFKDLIFAVLISFIAHNKILFNWNRDLKENKKMNLKEKSSKIKSYFSLPFHFIGIGAKTVFVADKNPKDKFLREEFVDTLVASFQDIDVIRRIADLWEIEDKMVKEGHDCNKNEKLFCKNCKTSFNNHLQNNIQKLLKALDVKSYIVLDLPITTIKNFINEDDIIEEIETLQCSGCFCNLEEHHLYCYNCGLEKEKRERKESTDREKMFNFLLAIYFAERKNLKEYDANKTFHKDTRETDVLLGENKKRILIEITTQVDVPKEYITEKAISLLIMKSILKEDKSYMIFWSLDKNNSSAPNYENVREMFDEELFFLVDSSLPKEILKNPTVGISQEDINLLRKEFDNMLAYTLRKIELLLK